MRRFYTLLFFVLIACLTQTSEARKLALLIGVNDYPNFPQLRGCVNDANILKTALMKIGFEEGDIHVLVTGGEEKDAPTKTNIEQNLAEIIATAEPSDFVFIGFSGQGFQNGDSPYICPVDAELNDLEGTSISVAKIMDDLSKSKAQICWIAIDACRNRVVHRGHVVMPPAEKLSSSPKIVLFQGCSRNEVCYETTNNDNKNGYFTKNLAAALSGEADCNHDGCLTLLEVCAWTANQTQLQVKEMSKTVQRPTLSADSVSDFVLYEDPNALKAIALVEEAQKAISAENYDLAVKLLDAAIALYPKVDSWKREQALVQKILEMKK